MKETGKELIVEEKETAHRWKFEPMLVDGKPARVESRLTFHIRQ